MSFRVQQSYFILLIYFALTSIGCKPTQNATNHEFFVSVKRFGAKGDGRTNDTRAFQKAIAYLRTSTEHELYIPKGHYLIDGLVIEDLKGKTIRGAGMYDTRLIPRKKIQNFIQIGVHHSNDKKRLISAVAGTRIFGFRIENKNKNAQIGLCIQNNQDNIIEHIQIKGFDTAMTVYYSWINSFRNLKIGDFNKVGINLLDKGLNANLFESIRSSGNGKNAICYKVGGNSVTFNNCTAEGGGIGWDFGYCRTVNLRGCHFEHGIPFSISGKAGIINIEGCFIWKPETLWKNNSRNAESISLNNTYLYTEGKRNFKLDLPSSQKEMKNFTQKEIY